VILLLPFDVVQDTGHMGQGNEPMGPIPRVFFFTLDENDRSGIDGHLRDMAEPVTEPVRVGSEDGDGLRHERVFPEETAGGFYRFFLLAVKGGLPHFPGDPPGNLLRMPVFLSHVHALSLADHFWQYSSITGLDEDSRIKIPRTKVLGI
jgi:hypothetical protein